MHAIIRGLLAKILKANIFLRHIDKCEIECKPT